MIKNIFSAFIIVFLFATLVFAFKGWINVHEEFYVTKRLQPSVVLVNAIDYSIDNDLHGAECNYLSCRALTKDNKPVFFKCSKYERTFCIPMIEK